ncbi:Flp pilus assembly complex ATPase component TadA [Phaeovibrio sulfidiphilus]|uniref:Flp pilus assembly complex ATPase component TadA n=1 Tax=Phaeovibrio sulfidiphilus TaxID=1220600 RepID=A0A8J7CF46_9PROT|nr:ATPase, T2SS/T4P/T4SS family [Phaeovibrio sulfidiphilus]MBE1237834.1 Flp pilus assembly complex ATPase component TadA [Phaeovibrio sulfidiphilus]
MPKKIEVDQLASDEEALLREVSRAASEIVRASEGRAEWSSAPEGAPVRPKRPTLGERLVAPGAPDGDTAVLPVREGRSPVLLPERTPEPGGAAPQGARSPASDGPPPLPSGRGVLKMTPRNAASASRNSASALRNAAPGRQGGPVPGVAANTVSQDGWRQDAPSAVPPQAVSSDAGASHAPGPEGRSAGAVGDQSVPPGPNGAARLPDTAAPEAPGRPRNGADALQRMAEASSGSPAPGRSPSLDALRSVLSAAQALEKERNTGDARGNGRAPGPLSTGPSAGARPTPEGQGDVDRSAQSRGVSAAFAPPAGPAPSGAPGSPSPFPSPSSRPRTTHTPMPFPGVRVSSPDESLREPDVPKIRLATKGAPVAPPPEGSRPVSAPAPASGPASAPLSAPVSAPRAAPASPGRAVARTTPPGPPAEIRSTEVVVEAELLDSNARLGEILIAGGLISRNQLRIGMIELRRTGKELGAVLVDLGFLTAQALDEVLAHNSGGEAFDPERTLPDPLAIATLPEEMARRLGVFPVGYEGGVLSLAMVNPRDGKAMDEARLAFGRETRIEPIAANSERDILLAIKNFYGHTLTVDGVLRDLEAAGEGGRELLHDPDGHHGDPIVRLVDALLFDAVRRRASDIHFEPDGAFLRVRQRIDGVLVQTLTFHKRYWPSIVRRIKSLAGVLPGMSPGLPASGRFSMTAAYRRVDFRASVVPTVHGENVVLRIQHRSATPLSLDHLGFAPDTLASLRRISHRPDGLFLVVGPVSSGKTATLYALMDDLSSPELSIATVEDPVEYDLPLLRQAQVSEADGFGFPEAIRTMLHQDPDVLLVGDIRDSLTADMAFRAARSGHRVYAAMHANDAFGGLAHLIDFGLTPGLLSGTLSGILSQRLARRLCPSCRQADYAGEEECALLGLDPERPPTLWRAVGCEACAQLGYRGRAPITELLCITPEIDALLTENAPFSRIRAIARKQTMRSMLADGLRLLYSGTIDLPSLMRAVDVTGKKA